MGEDDRFEDSFGADDEQHGIRNTVKKLFTAGIGAAFLTEDSIRSYLSDLKLPKDVMKLLIQGAQKSKEEVTSRVSKEVMEMLGRIDWTKEASKFMHHNKFRISMELEILPRDKKKEP